MSDGTVELALKLLIEHMAKHTAGALNHSNGNAFKYGLACGIHQGHREAKDIFESVLEADEPSQLEHLKIRVGE